jgi:RimJ/RimL family protein N-acetyltransferase
MTGRGFEPVTLGGRYVRLEPLTADHIESLLTVRAGGGESFGYIAVPSSRDGMCAYVETALRDQAGRRSLPFVTRDAGTGAVVGSTRFLNVEFWDWPPGSSLQRGADLPDVVEIGATWLAPSAQRSGINTEAKLLMLTLAFEDWRVHRVSLVTDARNERSRAAIVRLGASFDGVLRAARVAADGGVRDTAAYSILDREWPAVRAALCARLR